MARCSLKHQEGTRLSNAAIQGPFKGVWLEVTAVFLGDSLVPASSWHKQSFRSYDQRSRSSMMAHRAALFCSTAGHCAWCLRAVCFCFRKMIPEPRCFHQRAFTGDAHVAFWITAYNSLKVPVISRFMWKPLPTDFVGFALEFAWA